MRVIFASGEMQGVRFSRAEVQCAAVLRCSVRFSSDEMRGQNVLISLEVSQKLKAMKND